jgi:hypothetical protein
LFIDFTVMCNCSSLQGTRSLSIQGLSIPKVEHQTHDDKNGSFVGSEDESDTIQSSLIEQLVNMNLGLEKQIEALTLRRRLKLCQFYSFFLIFLF